MSDPAWSYEELRRRYDMLVRDSGTSMYPCDACGKWRSGRECWSCELNGARNAVRIYGDHVTGCKKSPCSCGFKEAWDRHAAKADHPGKKKRDDA